ncbi:hypothetical protein VTK73DRAFT_7799 [Phialemonium thermophilum]|uniref:F-box domain-containing protein n=1 Tax=Phialemonium thermophilum TaxID=223376 RepID=A0ABR3WCQ0_9PEZI
MSSASGPVQTHYCVPTRCSLCGFPLGIHENKFVAVLTEDGRLVDVFNRMIHPPPWMVSKEALYTPCVIPCHHGPLAFGCHVACFEATQDKPTLTFPILRVSELDYKPPLISPVAKVTAFDYKPAIGEDDRRRRWLEGHLAATIHRTTRLPLELAHLIASMALSDSYLHMYAFWTAFQTLLHQSPAVLDKEEYAVTPLQSIWASFVDIHGTKYVHCLSNQREDLRSQAGSQSKLLFDPDRDGAGAVLYVGRDHWGVRSILVSKEGDEFAGSEKVPGVWWEAVPISGDLSAKTDGCKLRRLVSSASSPGFPVLYDTPTPPPATLRFEPTMPFQRDLLLCRLPCYAAGITGFSACWSPQFVTVYAHRPDDGSRMTWAQYAIPEDAISSDEFMWFHVALDAGEKVEELWQVQLATRRSLVFKTDQGRTWRVGYHFESPRQRWTLLDRRTTGVDHIFFETQHNSGGRLLAFETPQPRPGPPLRLPSPPSPSPGGGLRHFCYTAAELDDLREATPCYGQMGGTPPAVIGLLLRYRTGRLAVLGQVRLDWLGTSLDVGVEEAGSLWFAFEEQAWSRVGLVSVGLCKPADARPGTMLFEVPRRGRLDWWFSPTECQLIHERRVSPSIKTGW